MTCSSRLRRMLAALIIIFAGGAVQAMSLERVQDTLYATGRIVDADFIAFRTQLEQPGLKRLVLVDSVGGDMWTALHVADAIRDAHLDTVAVGHCVSGCAILFVAGKNRAFGTGREPGATYLGIHGGYNRDSGQLTAQVGPALYAHFRRQLGAAMDDGLLNEAIYQLKKPQGLLMLFDVERVPTPAQKALLCEDARDHATCQAREGKDAYVLGLLTQKHTEKLDLPASMQPHLQYFGQMVHNTPFDFAAWEKLMTPLLCTKDDYSKAKQIFEIAASAPAHRAVAWSVGKDIGATPIRVYAHGGAATPEAAMFGALYACNFVQNAPRLCRVLTVDGQDLRPLHQLLEEQSENALAHLPVPLPSSVAEENADFCSGTATKRKTLEQGGYDTAAPCALKGVERIDTATLAKMLVEPQRPVLVDVSGDPIMVPGAFALLGAGVAFDDDIKDVGHHQRFMGLVRDAAPDLDQPLVFYAGPRGGWLSAHAALRAVQAGHAKVYWYRGGSPAWTAAGLPTVGKVALGVVY